MLQPSRSPLTARVVLFSALLAYLSLPRILLELSGSPSSLGSIGAHLLATTLMSVGLMSLREFIAPTSKTAGVLAFTITAQLIFFLRAAEAGLMESMGFGYGSRFFMHLDLEAARVGLLDYVIPVALGVSALLLASWPLWSASSRLPALPTSRRTALAGAGVAWLACSAGLWWMATGPEPGFSTGSLVRAAVRYYGDEPFTGGGFEEKELTTLKALGVRLTEGLRVPRARPPGGTPPNLVLVFLESFQDDFTDTGGSPHPGLTPNLDQLFTRMTRVDNAYNTATPTILALGSLLCGILPPGPSHASTIGGHYFSTLQCLPDMLREAGYYQVFMGAARKSFTNKGVFMEQHGFDEVYGDENWQRFRKYRKPPHRTTWGIHDVSLVKEALAKLELLKEREPFNLTLLTINTHKPGYRAQSCPVYRKGNRYLNGIHCTDHAVGRLFEGIDRLGLFESSVIVVIGDHMAFPVPQTVRDLGGDLASSYYGNVYMAIHSPILELPPRIDWFTHSPDLAPTILDLLGIPLEVPFQMGKSLLGERRHFQHLVGLETEVFRGKFYDDHRKSDRCTKAQVERVRLPSANSFFKPCQRVRMVSRINHWLFTGGEPSEIAGPEDSDG